tara:strand:- start:1090 stop:1545 length:456 start_codon:yes stop_codon:yes gene_type:complete
MEPHRSILEHNRKIFYKILKDYTLDQLNKVPKGFNNSIFWNVAHCIVVQQRLMYLLSGNTIHIDQDWTTKYDKGTFPKIPATPKELEDIKALLFSTLDYLDKDINNSIFNKFNSFTTSTNQVIDSFESAFTFVLFHDGIHLGSILAIRKFV